MSQASTTPSGIYGVAARFKQPTDLVKAAQAAREQGYTRFESYSPYPIPKAWEATGHKTPMSRITLLGGLIGCIGGFAFITWVNLIAYPINIGGRPLFSWPAFIPPTFEMTILLAGLFAAFGMFAVNGLPQPYHAVFNIPQFERASVDRYFLVIEADDARFDRAATAEFLRGFNPEEVSEVDY